MHRDGGAQIRLFLRQPWAWGGRPPRPAPLGVRGQSPVPIHSPEPDVGCVPRGPAPKARILEARHFQATPSTWRQSGRAPWRPWTDWTPACHAVAGPVDGYRGTSRAACPPVPVSAPSQQQPAARRVLGSLQEKPELPSALTWLLNLTGTFSVAVEVA